MMTKFMNKQRGLLAAIMALVMVFAGVAVMATEADADGELASLKINDAEPTLHSTVQDALAAYTSSEETGNFVITLLEEINTGFSITQYEGKNLVIEGNKKVIRGEVQVDGNGRWSGEETLIIKNANFIVGSGIDGIELLRNGSSGYGYAHNVTIDGCSFNLSGEGNASIRSHSANNVVVKNCDIDGGEVSIWMNSVNGLDIKEVSSEGTVEGISIGTATNTTIEDVDVASEKYALRMDGSVSTETIIKNCDFVSQTPVVLRYATNEQYTVQIDGNNTMNSENDADLWFVATAGNYDGTGNPPADDVSFNLTINDEELSYDGVAGSGDVCHVNTGGNKTQYDSLYDAIIAANNGTNAIITLFQGATLDYDVTLDNDVTLIIQDGVTLTIADGKVLTIGVETSGSTGANGGLYVYGNITGGSIEVYGSMYLESADVRSSVSEMDGSYISVTKPKKMTVTGDSTADLGVGYGNTLVLADLIVPAGKYIEAYGTVIIEGTVTVQSNNGFHIYKGGNAQIDGALVIEKTATIDGEAVVNGSVKVYNADGDAGLTVNGDVTVLGTMDILKPKTKGADNNVLTVGQNGDLDVEGTLTVTGKLVGRVCDMGTIVFNGVADNATIAVYDGVTLTIAAVDGKLTLTDDGIVDTTDMNYGYMLSDGNTVTIEDVKNVTVSVEVIETVKDKVRYIYTNMDVSGVITDIEENEKNADIDAKVGIANTSDISKSSQLDAGDVWPSTIPMCAITIGDVTLGKDTQLTINAINATVMGTVNVVADGSSIITPKVVDVEGTIIVAGDDVNLKVNGAMYVIDDITDDKDPITYYTTFENAIAAIVTAYDNEVTILGEVEVATAVDIPAEATVLVEGALTIDVDGKITVAADAVFDATGATANVDIDGMLVIMDKEYGLEGENKLTYQVYTETETTATYSGLVLALQNAVAGDVITLKQNADITKSVTIPEGVTLVVPNNVDLFIGDDEDKVTFTVAGKLEVQNGGEVRKALTSSTTDPAETTVSTEVTISIPGVVTIPSDAAIGSGIVMDDYVEFTMKVDGKDVHVHSNLAYAAENAVNRDVTIRGDVSGGDVTFTYDGKIQALAIKVPVNSTLTVGTLTIVGDGASIQADKATGTDENGTITGTIATAAGSVDLVKVSNVTLATSVDVDVDGSTDVVTVTGAPVGSFTVASGTVTAATGFAMNATKDNKMSVASGATLIAGESFVAAGDADAYVIIDGIVSVVSKTTAATITAASVSGSIAVDSGATVDIGGNSVITGTITVAEKTDDAEAGKANVKGNLFVGTAPAIGATGSLVGPFTTADNIDTTSNVIIAYPGSDLTGALIDVGTDGKSAAKSTEFYINGQLYMTAVTADGIEVIDFANDLGIEIPGLDTPQTKDTISGEMVDDIKWFIDEALKTPVTDFTKIGDSEKLYAEFAASEVDLVVSAGVGLQVYIDGLAIENFAGKITVGTHTVSFAVESGYDGANATITVNGVAVSNNGTFTVDVDADKITIIASGAVPAQSGSTVVVDDADDGMALTDILLIVLVVLIVIMAIIVALRMMRS